MTNPWIKFRANLQDSKLRLFCFPFAGGTATVFRLWARDLPADVELCPIEYPGHGTRRAEPLIRRVQEMVDAASSALQPELDKPYALYGHSLGALIAFELGRTLRKAGSPPKHIFVSGRKAPQLPRPHEDMHLMDDKAFIDTVMQRYGGIPQEVLDEPELLQLMMPMARADIEMYEAYQFSASDPLGCDITAYAGQEDTMHPAAEMEPWREVTSGTTDVVQLPGGHFFINTHKAMLLQDISRRLKELI